jgi:hypothetical protein
LAQESKFPRLRRQPLDECALQRAIVLPIGRVNTWLPSRSFPCQYITGSNSATAFLAGSVKPSCLAWLRLRRRASTDGHRPLLSQHWPTVVCVARVSVALTEVKRLGSLHHRDDELFGTRPVPLRVRRRAASQELSDTSCFSVMGSSSFTARPCT